MDLLTTYWMLPVGLAALGLALAGLTLWQMRQRRQARLALRVLSGRRRLLGEEIEERLAQLDGFDDADLADAVGEASMMVDALHVGSLERQAHLQNLEELALAQRHKIAILEHRLSQLQALPGDAPAPIEPEPPADDDEEPVTRERLEDDLLGRIGDLSPRRPKRGRSPDESD